MLKKSWDGLLEAQQQSGKHWYTVLRLRVTNPEMRSAELAKALSQELNKDITPANVRVLLHRAREKFSGLLIDVVAESLNSKSYADIEEELADLQLLEYCHAALEQLKEAQTQREE